MSPANYLGLLSVVFCFSLFLPGNAAAQTPAAVVKSFDQQGLSFDYSANWDLGGQLAGETQQLVLTEKELDAQIMIVVTRAAITSAKEQESVKHSVVEATINRLVQQYDNAGIKIERVPVSGEIAGVSAEGLQLRFTVDGQPGTTDIFWSVVNQRMVQLIFIRPEKAASQTSACWDMIRKTLKIHK